MTRRSARQHQQLRHEPRGGANACGARPGTTLRIALDVVNVDSPSKSKSNKIEKEASLADVSLDAAAAPAECARAAARQRWRVSGSAFALAAVCLLIFILGFPLTTIVSDGIFYFFIFMPPGVSCAASPSYRRTKLRSASSRRSAR